MRKQFALIVLLLIGFSNVYAEQGNSISLFCESGDPGGGGPTLYLDIEETNQGIQADIELAINSVNPESGHANVHTKRTKLTAVSIDEAGNTWLFNLSRSYQVRVKKEVSGQKDYWTSIIESRRGKFEPIELGCQ